MPLLPLHSVTSVSPLSLRSLLNSFHPLNPRHPVGVLASQRIVFLASQVRLARESAQGLSSALNLRQPVAIDVLSLGPGA